MPTAAILGPDPNNPLSMAVQQTVVTQQKMPRTADRLEVHEFFPKIIVLCYGKQNFSSQNYDKYSEFQ